MVSAERTVGARCVRARESEGVRRRGPTGARTRPPLGGGGPRARGGAQGVHGAEGAEPGREPPRPRLDRRPLHREHPHRGQGHASANRDELAVRDADVPRDPPNRGGLPRSPGRPLPPARRRHVPGAVDPRHGPPQVSHRQRRAGDPGGHRRILRIARGGWRRRRRADRRAPAVLRAPPRLAGRGTLGRARRVTGVQDWLQPSRLRVIGLDLAWSEDNPSGVSVLEWDGRSARLTQETRADLGDNRAVLHFVSNVAGDGPCVIAVDCPLAVPNAKGRRVCDALVSRHFRAYDAGTHPANRELFVAKKRLRGERLAKALRRSGFSLDPRTQASNQVIEVYPHPAIVSLFGLDLILKYKGGRKRTIEFRREELGRLRGYLNGLGTANPPFAIDDPVLHESLDDLRGRRFK
ncbi:MAG: DUF429 domain-containing protein, partial [Methanobacteriota archaeon]